MVAGGSAEPLKPYFVIGAPSDPELQSAYRSALSILERAPNDPTIYEESQIDGLVAEIESEMQVHETKS